MTDFPDEDLKTVVAAVTSCNTALTEHFFTKTKLSGAAVLMGTLIAMQSMALALKTGLKMQLSEEEFEKLEQVLEHVETTVGDVTRSFEALLKSSSETIH